MNLKKLLFWSRLSFPSEKLINRIKLLRKKIRVQLKSFGSRQTWSLKSKGGSVTIWDRTKRRLLASSRRDAGDSAHQLLSPVKLVWLCSTSITKRRVTANIDRAISFCDEVFKFDPLIKMEAHCRRAFCGKCLIMGSAWARVHYDVFFNGFIYLFLFIYFFLFLFWWLRGTLEITNHVVSPATWNTLGENWTFGGPFLWQFGSGPLF